MSGARAAARPPAGRNDGFTLFEVIVAFAILMLVLIPTAEFLSDQATATGNLRNRVVASNLADGMIESARNLALTNFSALAAGADGSPAATTQKVGSITYTLTTVKRWQDTSVEAANGCDSNGNGIGTGSPDSAASSLLLVQAKVSWPDMAGTPPVEADTTVVQPYSGNSANLGSFELSVSRATGAPTANVPVQVTGPSGTANYQTDNNGCLYLADQTPGTYTLTLAQAGDVDPTEATQPTEPVKVTAGQFTAAAPMAYDSGMTVNVSFSGPPPPLRLPVTFANTSLSPSGAKSFPGSSYSFAPLYPFTNGYTGVWAGDCPDSNPQATAKNNSPLYPSAPDAPAAPVGSTVSVTIPLDTLKVTVHNPAGAPVTGSGVAIVATSDPNMAVQCADSSVYDLPGTTDATGQLTAGMPYGVYQVFALNGAGATEGTPATVTMAPGATVTATVVN